MKNESVAILDIRSNEVCFLLGSKGVNGTFVFSGMQSEKYDGFSLDGFFDVEAFRRTVVRTISNVQQNYKGKIEEIYVGVPSPFVFVATKGQNQAFESKRKLTAQDVDNLYDRGLNELAVQGRCIRRSAMFFSLGDNRRYFSANELYGVPTTLLKGGLCYYYVSDQFYRFITDIMESMAFTSVKFIPSSLAQSIYLLHEKKREGYAFLLDIGFITSTISVVYGNGIVHEESFDCGIASVLVELMKTLEVDFSVAEEILSLSNISGGVIPEGFKYTTESGERSFPVKQVNDVIKCAMDVLCEGLEKFLYKYYHEKNSATMTVNPISITGEGVLGIKGITEHIEKRIGWVTETVYPDLPYYDKPTCSSRIALLNMAISDETKNSFWQRLRERLGGKRNDERL